MSLDQLTNPLGAGIDIKPRSVTTLLPLDPVNPVTYTGTSGGAAVPLELQQSGCNIGVPTQTAANLTLVLPSPANGLRYKIVLQGNLATYTVTLQTNASANLFTGRICTYNAGAIAVTNVSAHHNAVFGTTAVLGDWVSAWSDGTNWYLDSWSSVNGAITSSA